MADWDNNDKRFVFYRLYHPISGLSRDGKQATWLGLSFSETSAGQGRQVPWHSILFEPQRLYEWQSMCISYSRKTNRMRLFMNGIKELDAKNTEEHIEIPKDYFSTSHLFVMHRGSISDIQLYSNALEDEDLKKWTTCELDKPGDVFNWDVKMINMSSHDEKMIISVKKVSKENFCVSKKGEKSPYHIFGQGSDIT